jgi:trk system potassium uptake protein TrkH
MVKINGQVYANAVVEKVLAFVFLYLTIVGIGAIVLSFTGMSFDESIGTAVSSMSSYGFGLGRFGPSGNFSSATVFAKYVLCFLMIVGRLEVFTVLSLFTKSLWKR